MAVPGIMTEELTAPLRVSGTPRVWLRVGILDLDTISCFGEGTETDTGCYRDVERRIHTEPFEVVARGWANASFVTDDDVFEAGHRIGVVVSGSTRRPSATRVSGAT